MVKLCNKRLVVAFAALIFTSIASYSSAVYLRQFTFNEAGALDKWSKMLLKGEVEYKLLKSEENGFVEALSTETCSALYYKIGFKLEDYPILSWKWKVLKFPDKSAAMTEKEKDDYAARVYVIFPFLSFSSSKFLEYVWDDKLPAGTITKSYLGDNVRIIVARSGGPEPEGEWVQEERNIYDDYTKAFGRPPSMSAGAVAIMCDADSTMTEAASMFDEIYIGSQTESKKKEEQDA